MCHCITVFTLSEERPASGKSDRSSKSNISQGSKRSGTGTPDKTGSSQGEKASRSSSKGRINMQKMQELI